MEEKRQKSLATIEQEAMLHDNTVSPRDDRRIRGKLLRESVPHDAHAVWKAPASRRDPLEILAESDDGRIPELIPLRYGRMSHTPFTFYRGAASIMAADMAATPSTGIPVQACGDCHLMNFGAFATPERNIVFDINDFDETLPAPWEWDVKRLAVSFVLAARDNGLKAKAEEDAAKMVAQAYRTRMTEFSRMAILDIWYARVDWESVIAETTDEALQKQRMNDLKKAMKKTVGAHYFPKLTQMMDGQYLLKDNPPTIVHIEHQKTKEFHVEVTHALKLYRESLQEDKQRLFDRYRLVDTARKVVGIGSVGTNCAVALLLAPDDEPLLLQIKEARPSVMEPYTGKSTYDNNGRRVVAGQRIAQSASDIFLGWTKFFNKDYYVRQLRDTKVKHDPALWGAEQMLQNAEVMGWALARAHARSGDAAFIRGYLGNHDTFDQAIARFSIAYANQVEQDYEKLTAAISSGKIKTIVEEET